MKIYIVNDSYTGTDNIESKYYLVTEDGEILNSWISSNKSFARYDLLDSNKELQENLTQLFGDYKVVFLGDDCMTKEDLICKVEHKNKSGERFTMCKYWLICSKSDDYGYCAMGVIYCEENLIKDIVYEYQEIPESDYKVLRKYIQDLNDHDEDMCGPIQNYLEERF